jgi:hypothetical protein
MAVSKAEFVLGPPRVVSQAHPYLRDSAGNTCCLLLAHGGDQRCRTPRYKISYGVAQPSRYLVPSLYFVCARYISFSSGLFLLEHL